MSADRLGKFRNMRASIFKRGTGYIITYYVLRFRREASLTAVDFDNHITQSIIDSWSNSFSNVFVTQHFLAISTRTNALKSLGKSIRKPKNKKSTGPDDTGASQSNEASLIKLNEFVDFIETTLSEYGSKILRGKRLFGFFASLINCQPYNEVNSVSDTFENWIISNPAKFTELKSHFNYLSTGKIASFLTIKNFPEFAVQQFFDALIQKNVEMVITQHCELLHDDTAKGIVEDKLRIFQSFAKFNQLLVGEVVDLLNRLQANDVKLSTHTISIQVLSDDEEGHRANLNKLSKLLTQNGFISSTEFLNNEPLYFSQFPSLRNSNVRKKRLTTDNLVDLISFSTSGTGNKQCSFGPTPTAHFASVDGNIYDFIFQVNESQNSLGHTLIIGDTGSGKTTFISFLLAYARRHAGMKIVAFDQLRGQEIATRMQRGEYINFGENSFIINPLLLPDSPHNRSFIIDFLSDLVDATEDERLKMEKNIDKMFGWEEKNRNLDEITYLFTQEGEKLHDKLSMWQTGGIYSGYFNGKENSFEFKNMLTTFDFTHIISNPKVLGLMTSFLSNVFFSSSDGSPRIIFIDELRRYLESEIFSSIIQRFLEEFRKLNGVFIGAVQNINQLWDSPVGKRNIGNFGKFIIFPISGNINKEAYIDGIGLNDNEIDWLRSADVHDRQVLIKTKGGSSTIVNVDLKFLGKYLRIFDSSSQNVSKLNRFMVESPDTYREQFLNS